MPLFDIHTHSMQAPARTAVVNLPDAFLTASAPPLPEGRLLSAGIHPWYRGDWPTAWVAVEQLAREGKLYALGECGLDPAGRQSREVQMAYFSKHIVLADALGLPLIIHCVKDWAGLFALTKQRPLRAPRIVHGFRGKPQQALQLLRAGFSLSFGPRFNAESLRLCPPDRRYEETDDGPLTIEQVAELHRQALRANTSVF